jgi:two-component system, response regulator, stage 0 sporulation protein F
MYLLIILFVGIKKEGGIFLAYTQTDVKKILVVEDEILIRSSLARALRKDGYVVSEAKDHTEALENLKKESCDLAIVDLYLEDGLHGLRLLREIHQWSPQAKVIVISAFGTSEVKEAAMMEGIDRFYDKPFEIMEIRNALVEMLQGIGKISTKN